MIRFRSVVRCMILGTIASAAGCGLGVTPDEGMATPGAKVSKKPPVRVDNGTTAAPRGVYKIVDRATSDTSSTEQKALDLPLSPTKRTIFVNRHGGTYTSGDDDSSTNTSSIPGGTATVPAYSEGDAAWSTFFACVKKEFSPFNVDVVDVDPGNAPHIEAVIGGQPGDVGMGSGVGGVSPMTNDCALIERSIVFIFSDVFGDPTVECEVAAQEIGHSIGMDHEYLCEDPMTYLSGCGHKTFQNKDVSCGEDAPRACMCTQTQNSVQFMLDRLGPASGGGGTGGSGAGGSGAGGSGAGGSGVGGGGGNPPGPDTTPPVVTLLSPDDGSTEQPNASVTITASITDDVHVADAALLWEVNGKIVTMDCAAPPAKVTCTAMAGTYTWSFPAGSGPRSFSVRGTDTSNNTTTSPSRHITLGQGNGAGGGTGTGGSGAGAGPGAGGGGPPPMPPGGAAVSVDAPVAGASVHAGDTVTVDVSADAASEVWMRWKSPNGDVIYPLDQVSATKWSIDIQVSDSAVPGPRTIRVTAWDNQGGKTTAPDRQISVAP